MQIEVALLTQEFVDIILLQMTDEMPFYFRTWQHNLQRSFRQFKTYDQKNTKQIHSNLPDFIPGDGKLSQQVHLPAEKGIFHMKN